MVALTIHSQQPACQRPDIHTVQLAFVNWRVPPTVTDILALPARLHRTARDVNVPLLLVIDIRSIALDCLSYPALIAEELARKVLCLRARCSSFHVVLEGESVASCCWLALLRSAASMLGSDVRVRIHPSLPDALRELQNREHEGLSWAHGEV